MYECDSLEYVQHFDAHDFNKKRKQKKKENIQFTSFWIMYNMKYFEKLTNIT